VLPKLTHDDIEAIGSGRHQMDAFVRRYIHENLRYRFVTLPDGATMASSLPRVPRVNNGPPARTR
jgi:hypothetical protein